MKEVLCLAPRSPGEKRLGVAVLIISFNTTKQTLRCLDSLRSQKQAPDWIGVLDNAPESGDLLPALANIPAFECSTLRLFQSDSNLGFAAGSNALIEFFMDIPDCDSVILLNNDATATSDLVAELCQSVAQHENAGLAGGRMHRLSEPTAVDTLGISVYASLMPADRMELTDYFLGPTGGCAILTRCLVEAVVRPVGYIFDPRFFCYCEDTDLVLRANLLGFKPVFVDRVLALHEGQASSGGRYNDFIAYHGLRNSVWMVAKVMPGRVLVKFGALFVMAHMMSGLRYLATGKYRVLLAVYRDAINGLPSMLDDRRRLMSTLRIAPAELDRRIVRSFYRKGYFSAVLKEFLALRRRRAGQQN